MRNRRAQERIAEAGTFRPRSALKSRMRPPTHGEGAGASAYASHPAPAGFYWDFVTYLNAPVVALVKV